jgi:GNAT superfamily N-acetyltransferase
LAFDGYEWAVCDDCTMTIELARRGDEAEVLALVRKAYARYVSRIGKEPGPMLDDYGSRIDQGAAWVLKHGDAVRGVLVLIDNPGYLLLDNVAVDPDCQGQGLGRRLIEFAEAEAKRRGHPEIRLYTNEKMSENIALYRHLGFDETHRATEGGYARIFMRKSL